MEELTPLAGHCGLGEEPAELAVGGFLSVLKKSQKLEKEDFTKIDDETIRKKYERAVLKNSLPNPLMMLLPRPDFAPPGPPPLMVAKAITKKVRKARRKDKDAGNTADAIEFLTKKSKLERYKLIQFMQVFIIYVEKEKGIDISEILCLLSENDGGDAEAEDAAP